MNAGAQHHAHHVVGPLRVGRADVKIHTNSTAFARIASWVFVDLFRSPGDPPAAREVVFSTIRHDRPTLHWAIHRDGRQCEVELRDDAVLVHQQWELNRLAIESQRAVVHAASVAIEGHAVLLAGRSHSGKTTLAAWLASRRHFDYIGDEAAAIDGRARARPFLRPLGVRAGGPLDSPTSNAVGLAHRFMPEEQLVPASTIGSALCRAPTPVRLIVFPHFSPDATPGWTRLTQADAIERLAALTPGLARHGAAVFRRLVHLVASAGAVAIDYRDVADAADVVLAAMPDRSCSL